MLRVEQTNKFLKQLSKCKKRGKDVNKLYNVVRKLANCETLDAKHRNHYLESRNCWDCHIEPDWILLYRIHDDILSLELLETGTHSDLF